MIQVATPLHELVAKMNAGELPAPYLSKGVRKSVVNVGRQPISTKIEIGTPSTSSE